MRLRDWGAVAPIPAAAGPKVLAVAEATLATLGATPDPDCWVAWGEDPGVRWVLLAATPAGLVTVHVRVIVPQEGPRALLGHDHAHVDRNQAGRGRGEQHPAHPGVLAPGHPAVGIRRCPERGERRLGHREDLRTGRRGDRRNGAPIAEPHRGRTSRCSTARAARTGRRLSR